ncbi:Receptor protein kinase-like protein [Planoprotostelium fungivorum]|uniref:Receptor protein kinase-like protein n=1 Tax=Planoprotostelium fungivorum TaxID=1890364 RepID=A0A2P6NGU2_9EUKA|nr:Receptor protein kinase-like protein [Planoprotostelium fungivorum]
MTGHRVTSRLLVLRDRRLYRVHLLTAVERISTFCSASDNEMCSGRHRKSHKQPSALKTDTKPNMRNLIILSLFCLCSARFIETTLHRQESCETVRSKRYYAQPSCQLYGPVTVLFNVSGGGDTITLTRVTDSPLNPITGPCQTTHDREISITTLGLHRCSGNYSFAPNETFATVDEIPLQYGNESVVIGFYTDSACTTLGFIQTQDAKCNSTMYGVNECVKINDDAFYRRMCGDGLSELQKGLLPFSPITPSTDVSRSTRATPTETQSGSNFILPSLFVMAAATVTAFLPLNLRSEDTPASEDINRKHPRAMKLESFLPVIFTFTLFVTVSQADIAALMQGIWSSLEGPSMYWRGINVCNSTDYVGVACDTTQSWPVRIVLRQNLNGTIPSSIGSLINLTTLDLSTNSLAGPIPSSIGSLRSLQYLRLRSNRLDGPIPSTVGDLSSIRELDLSNNRLQGSIADTIGHLNSLLSLDLSGNRLNGSIPTSLGSLSSLTALDLSSNSLTGSIPSLIGNIITLQSLNLYYNQLGGSIPSSFSNLSSLNNLAMYGNQLNGNIPSLMDGLTQLEFLDLSSNQFDGIVPSLGGLRNLQTLSLANNSLIGSLPDFVYNLTGLTSLYLDTNRFNGTISPLIGNLAKLTTLYLHDNQLGGNIPSTLGNLSALQFLHMSNNQLNGSIPSSIAGLFSLKYLYLYNNQLSGPLPGDSIINLPQLRDLNLQNNSLNGTVVGRNASLPALLYLNLYDNDFTSMQFINVTNACNIAENPFNCSPPPNVSSNCAQSISDLNCASTADPVTTRSTIEIATASITISSLDSPQSTTSITSIIGTLYSNNTIISTAQAQATQIISAVILALLRNTSSFEYQSRDVLIKLQTFNLTHIIQQKIQSSITDRNISVSLPASIFTSQRGVSVYSGTREIEVRGTNELINISMGAIRDIPLAYAPMCQYWNENDSQWLRDGCSLVIDGNVGICQSTHLTNFSIGIAPVEAAPTSDGSSKKLIIIIVCTVMGAILLSVVVGLIIYLRLYRYEKGEEDVSMSMVLDIDGIEWKEKIAETNHGQVWRGTYKETTAVVIRKCLPIFGIAKECDVLKGLHHPNIVQYLGCKLAGDRIRYRIRSECLSDNYIVFEWMNDGTLHNYLTHHPQPNMMTLRSIGRDLSSALSYLSSVGFVHTSVIPGKILLSDRNSMTVKLQCLSCVVTESTAYQSNKNQFYMAPEIIRKKRYSASGHVYSIGVLFWSMATNNHHLYNDTEDNHDVTFVTHNLVDGRMVEIISECTNEEGKRPSLSELSKKMEKIEAVVHTVEKTPHDLYAFTP